MRSARCKSRWAMGRTGTEMAFRTSSRVWRSCRATASERIASTRTVCSSTSRHLLACSVTPGSRRESIRPVCAVLVAPKTASMVSRYSAAASAIPRSTAARSARRRTSGSTSVSASRSEGSYVLFNGAHPSTDLLCRVHLESGVP